MDRRGFLAVAVIAVLAIGIYANTLDNQFVYDDEFLVYKNQLIQAAGLPKELFTKDIHYGAGRQSNVYRPLQMLSYRLDYYFWKLNPLGYHLTNILLHLLTAAAIFYLLTAILKQSLIPFLSACLFVSCPIHTEAVSYISGRADPLAALFLILGLYFYLKKQNSNQNGYYFLSIVLYALALFSRETSLIFLPLLVMHDYVFKRKKDWQRYAPFVILSILYLILRIWILAIPAATEQYVRTTLAQRTPGIFNAIAHYLRLLILPLNLHMEYIMRLSSFLAPQTIFGLSIFLASVFFAVKSLKRQPIISFAIFWFWLNFIPVSNIFALNAFMAEHWMYLPSIGFFLLAAFGFKLLLDKDGWLKPVAVILLVVLISFYSGLTIYQNQFWQDALTLYTRILKFSPNSSRVHNSLGAVYYFKDDYVQAEEEFKKAIAIKPSYADAYNNLGSTYTKKKLYLDAVRSHEKAAALAPDCPDFYVNLGNAYLMLGEKQKGKGALEKALSLYRQQANAKVAQPLAEFIANHFLGQRGNKGR